jgi:hypothetical protein
MNVIGLMVRMSRRIDNERSCCDSVCVIHPGKGPHVGQLRCACCGRHRGWLSHGAVSWITDQVRKHGVPAGPYRCACSRGCGNRFSTDRVGAAHHEKGYSPMKTQNPCINAACEELERAGIRNVEIANGSRHPQLRFCINGVPRIFSTCGTPSDWRSPENTRRDMRHFLRKEGVISAPEPRPANTTTAAKSRGAARTKNSRAGTRGVLNHAPEGGGRT